MKLLLCCCVVFACLAGGASAQVRPVVTYDGDEIQKLADRLNHLKSENWQDGYGFGQELANLPSPVGYQILRDNWSKGASLMARKQMFKAFVFGDHPDTLLVLNLGMMDPHPSMQAWSATYLKSIAFIDFVSQPQAYAPWFESVKGLSLAEAKKRGVDGLMERFATGPQSELSGIADCICSTLNMSFGSNPKIFDGVRRLIVSPPPGPVAYRAAARVIDGASFTPEQLSTLADLSLKLRPQDSPSEVLEALAKRRPAGYLETMLRIVRTQAGGKDQGYAAMLLGVLAASDDPATIVEAAKMVPLFKDPYDQVARNTLSNSLGLSTPEAYASSEWWTTWANTNGRFYGKPLATEAPSFTIKSVPHLDYIPDSDDVKGIPSKSFLVGGDTNQRYIVSGNFRAGQAKKVLVVMPGGDGSIEFHPFVKRIQKNCLSSDWVVVEPIAPAWSDDPNRVVWPSIAVPYASAKFTTEQFVDGILDDVAKVRGLKVEGVYMLGWSSSGPALYSYAAHGKHKVDGAIIAMSIFNGGLIGNAKSLHVKRVFLLHSPTDFIPIAQAELSEKTLRSMGIPVSLQQYKGGHGWTGPVYQEISSGLEFLQAR